MARADAESGLNYDEEEDAAFDRAMAKLRARGLFPRQHTKTLVKEFDPDQPRDETGRWTSGGGGSSSPMPPPPPGTPAAGQISARQQKAADWVGDQDDEVFVHQDDRSRALQEDWFGRELTNGEIARLANGVREADVRVEVNREGMLSMMTDLISDDGKTLLTANRLIDRQDGELVMYNTGFHLSSRDTEVSGEVQPAPGGVGTRLAAAQLETAHELGIARVDMEAGGRPGSDLNGYYTWPRMGFNSEPMIGPNAPNMSPELRERVAGFASNGGATVLDLMATPEGRKWWQDNGFDIEASFDVGDRSSPSWQVMDAYLEEVGYGPR